MIHLFHRPAPRSTPSTACATPCSIAVCSSTRPSRRTSARCTPSEDGATLEAADVIRSVVMEEMLHMALAANVLNAIGGSPSLTTRVRPAVPGHLPYSDGQLVVRLAGSRGRP